MRRSPMPDIEPKVEGPVQVKRIGDVAVLSLNAPPVNALSSAVRLGLASALWAAAEDSAVRAVVLTGQGATFCAGADISEFDAEPTRPVLWEVLDILDACAKPVVAALQGAALGGGLELAMACHYRLASPDTMLGLPEVKLGLLPGAGGTQRLPRLIGLPDALKMIVLGEVIGADRARTLGLVDRILDPAAFLDKAVAFAADLAERGGPLRRTRDLDERMVEARRHPNLIADFATGHARALRGFDAPWACLRALQGAVNLPFETGLEQERSLFRELKGGPQSAAQRYVFFAERKARRAPAANGPVPTIASVGVIGAGTMGRGIAATFLSAGMPTVMIDSSADALAKGASEIRKIFEAAEAKGRLAPGEAEARMGLLTLGADLAATADCDLIIEAVIEDMAVKKAVLAALDKTAKPGAILATNTSYLDVDEMASATGRPEQVIGAHFFSPAHIMRLLEVVRGAKTSTAGIAAVMTLATRLGKAPVLVGVCHGFVGNRMLAARRSEANRLIVEGAMPWDVDRVLYEFGMPMGPFAMADLAGLDLGWSRPPIAGATIRDSLNEMERRGQKTGAGFYDYDDKRRPSPSPIVEALILDFSRRTGVTRRLIDDQEILDRCLLSMINEGARLLAEGVAARASDIDVVWVNGYGWPTYRGGPMYYADTLGAAAVLERLRDLQGLFGEAFKPAPLIERLAANGGRFADL